MSGQLVGALVQAYTFAKRHEPSTPSEIERLGRRLEPDLRGRVDALGTQAERLLTVECGEVLTELEAVEGEKAD